MVAEIIQVIQEFVTGMIGWVVSAFSGITEIFYNSTDSSLTLVGVLALFGVGVGIVSLAINFIRSMITK